ncbi:peptidylprolyl isomerase [Candidatus Liberibacter brunswickensis]|uniref:peptidylprolyl isomerase n=1 Tax=Candidatus Liberibacter brunswickensis TaxID=1968796 RepID=UPI002FE1CA4A
MILNFYSSFNSFIKLSISYFIIFIACITCVVPYKSWAMSGQIYVTVNGEAITDFDISKRIALLKLENINGEIEKIAAQDLIIETLKKQELGKHGITLNSSAMNYFFAQHAINNRLSEKDFINFLEEKGIGENHFKQYLAVQLIWNDFIKKEFMLKYKNPEEEILSNIQKAKNNLTIKEYLIKLILFSIPDNQLQNEKFVQKRINEAKESRFRFPKDCNKIEYFASKIQDVSVSKAQYVLESDLNPQLQSILRKEENNTTDPFVTERGVEYIAICNKRDLNGEIALQEYFKNNILPKKIEENVEEYMQKLLSTANIHYYQ